MSLKEVVGQVTSSKMDKTVTVAVSNKIKHKKYGKIILRTKKYYAHDENNKYHAGDKVRIRQTRPISKRKCWQVIEAIN